VHLSKWHRFNRKGWHGHSEIATELYFKNPGIIESISYRNGQTAPKGSELARLQNDEYRFVVEKAEVNIEINFETV